MQKCAACSHADEAPRVYRRVKLFCNGAFGVKQVYPKECQRGLEAMAIPRYEDAGTVVNSRIGAVSVPGQSPVFLLIFPRSDWRAEGVLPCRDSSSVRSQRDGCHIMPSSSAVSVCLSQKRAQTTDVLRREFYRHHRRPRPDLGPR